MWGGWGDVNAGRRANVLARVGVVKIDIPRPLLKVLEV